MTTEHGSDMYANASLHTLDSATNTPAEVQPRALRQPRDQSLAQQQAAALATDQHPARVYLARLAPSSRRVMGAALKRIAGILTDGRHDAFSLPWSTLRYQHTAAVRAALAEGRYAPATANQHLSALRGVLKECWRLGYVDADDYHQAADLQAIRGNRLPRGRALPSGEVRALFDACAADGSALAIRDTAILAVQYGTGLRRAEVVALNLDDLERATGALRVHGKGNKERLAYVTYGGRTALGEWLELRGAGPGPLFWPIGKTGVPRMGRLSGQAILYVARRRSVAARVPTFSPHDLRRSFISDLLDAGADISTVQQLAGHAQITTTARYDRRGEAAKQRAMALLHVPYDGRHVVQQEALVKGTVPSWCSLDVLREAGIRRGWFLPETPITSHDHDSPEWIAALLRGRWRGLHLEHLTVGAVSIQAACYGQSLLFAARIFAGGSDQVIESTDWFDNPTPEEIRRARRARSLLMLERPPGGRNKGRFLDEESVESFCAAYTALRRKHRRPPTQPELARHFVVGRGSIQRYLQDHHLPWPPC